MNTSINTIDSDQKTIIVVIIGLSMISFAILTSTIWIEKSYTFDCSLMNKLNEDGWLRQFFELEHKASIKSMIEHDDNKTCSIVLDASIMTHTILLVRGL